MNSYPTRYTYGQLIIYCGAWLKASTGVIVERTESVEVYSMGFSITMIQDVNVVSGLFLLVFFLFPRSCGVDVYTPPCITVVRVLPRLSLLVGIITHSIQPYSLMPSSLPPPLHLHFRRRIQWLCLQGYSPLISH